MRGEDAEARAAEALAGRGLRLRARNFRCRGGEIDLVMEDGDTLVFVEVRLRSSPRFGSAVETVDARKRARLLRCAEAWLQRHGADRARPCRFDVVSLDGGGLAWHRDAFGAE
jgi:putative endonuclease